MPTSTHRYLSREHRDLLHRGISNDLARPCALPGLVRAGQLEQLQTLKVALASLTPRQREVFVAVALNDIPMDAVALQLGSNRNAIYKNLFDARRRLRQKLADAGHPVAAQEG